jgi:hypothetical protein
MNIGWKMKLTKMWQRALASYLRAIAAILGTFALANATTDKIDLSALAALGWSLLGAAIAPIIVFVTETANLLESDEAPPAP